jgi:hypothetical protein
VHVRVTKPDLPVNRLLATLPAAERQHFLAGCSSVELAFAEVLVEPYERIRHVYFPLDSFISLIKPIDKRATLEVGLVGDEGMLGVSLILDVDLSPLHAVVQGQGSALRMKRSTFRRELAQLPALQILLKQYLYVMLDQLAQTAVCSRFHVVEARKLIRYSRENIAILNRVGLESAYCECYATDNAVYARILSQDQVAETPGVRNSPLRRCHWLYAQRPVRGQPGYLSSASGSRRSNSRFTTS